MKNKLLFILMLAIGYALPSSAQKEIPPKTTFTPPTVAPNLSKVFSVTIDVDSVTHPNNSARDFYLRITFKSMGTGAIKYNFIDLDRQASGWTTSSTPQTLTPGGTGTDIVLMKRGTFIRSAHTYNITTTSPNQISTNYQ